MDTRPRRVDLRGRVEAAPRVDPGHLPRAGRGSPRRSEEGSGFDHGSEAALEGQTRQLRGAVERYQDHPALLMWGLANEAEGDGGDPRCHEHLESLARMVAELDPHHPTMTVIAELGPDGHEIRDLERLAPSLDVIGVNSYAGVATLPERYRRAGGTRPYLVTEFGPRGHRESRRTDWGVPVEMSSTETARLEASDADRDRLRVEWVLRTASAGDGAWGGHEDILEEFPRAIVPGKKRTARIRMPEAPGPYRPFAHVRDGKGGGAVHNVPLLVEE